MHTPADRLTLLEVWYNVRVALTPDGQYLDVSGPAEAVDVVTPMLRKHRDDIVRHLRRIAPDGRERAELQLPRDVGR